MNIYEYNDYRECIRGFIKDRSLENKGVISALAKAMQIHTSLMSMVLSGKRELSLEQGYDLCVYFDLNSAETEYFTLLLQFERAGTKRLKLHLQKKIEFLQKQSKLLKNKIDDYRNLTEAEQSQFYTSWLYAAIHLYCGIGSEGKSLNDMVKEFKKSRKLILNILSFLCKVQLLKEIQGRYFMTEKSTVIGIDSPHLIRHHMNWRNRALMRMDDLTETELMTTAPFSVSYKDFEKIRELLLDSVKKTTRIIQGSTEEVLACLNIDLFYVGSSQAIKEEVYDHDK